MEKNNITYLHDLVAKIDSRIDDMAETLVRHDENLKQHMRRSELNEQAVELLRQELKPVKQHVDNVTFMLQALGVVGTFLLVASTVYMAMRS